MRKNLTIVLGLVLLGGIVTTGVFASARSYHQQLYQQSQSGDSVKRYHVFRNGHSARTYKNLRVRPTSRRLGQDERGYNEVAKYQVPTTDRGVVGVNGEVYYNDGDSARSENTRTSNRWVVRNGQYTYKDPVHLGQYGSQVIEHQDVATDYVVDSKAIQFSNDLGYTSDANGAYRSANTSLAFRVLEFPDTKCTETNFRTCVLSSARDYRDSISVGEAKVYDFFWRQTKQNDFTYYLTYRETFGKGKNVYFIYYALNPNTGGLVRVESVAFENQEGVAAKQAHEVFETLRFK